MSDPGHPEGPEQHPSLCVVADRFAPFAAHARVFTVAELSAMIADGDFDEGSDEIVVHLGQGIRSADCDRLTADLARRGSSRSLRICGDPTEREAPTVVHKTHAENVLLANLKADDELRFVADLVVDRDNELLLDHQTGRHVQGIVVIEAQRQMCLAVFEAGFRPRWPDLALQAVWTSMTVNFDAWLFPLPAAITCEVRADLTKPKKQMYEMRTKIDQFGREIASGDFSFVMAGTERLASLERRAAAAAVTSFFDARPVGA